MILISQDHISNAREELDTFALKLKNLARILPLFINLWLLLSQSHRSVTNLGKSQASVAKC